MNYEEEQQQELEVLPAIYMEDFKASDDPKNFKIAIDSDRATDEREPVHLEVTYTEKYPEEPPKLKVWQSHMLQKYSVQMENKLNKLAQEEVGAVMVMTLVQAARDWLDSHEGGEDQADGGDEEQAADGGAAPEKTAEETEAEQRRKHGTPVTMDTFLAWRTAFEAEMAAKRSAEDKAAAERRARPSGRKLFEMDAQLAASDLLFGQDSEIEHDPTRQGAMMGHDDDDDDSDSDPDYELPEMDEALEAALASGATF
mmetsp:Transcript_21210/g.49795  ORF Transcript_21210/g.49795 Transcript_21210/m.49795 type:complete len:256 (+) Transcript_21210:69-836(+)